MDVGGYAFMKSKVALGIQMVPPDLQAPIKNPESNRENEEEVKHLQSV